MRSVKYFWLCITLGGLATLAGCANTVADPENTAAAGLAAGQVSPGPALWALQDSDTTVYLFGTVHILRPETQWRKPHINSALEAADALYFEADTESPEVQAALAGLIQETGIYNDGRSLLTVLGGDSLATVRAAADALQVPMPALAPLKPWMAGLQLSVMQLIKTGYNPESGVETILLGDPALADKSRGYFETAEQQIRLFDRLSERDQIEMLVASAQFIVEDPGALDGLVSAWESGNTAEIAEQLASVEAFGNQTVYDAVLTQRNRDWVPLIESLLEQPGVKFVAVGAGHLAGSDSVLAMLESKGHSIKRL